jgi:FtsZ-binding cell division protein ZapB
MERELTLDETVALLKDRNAKARQAITALTAKVAELREENKKLHGELVATGLRKEELAQALRAYQGGFEGQTLA